MSTVEAELLPPETKPTQAIQVREQGGAIGRALSAAEIGERLRFIKQVMEENMTEGVDYGKIPGCGDKPGLFQPGAQKLAMLFQLRDQVKKEVLREFPNLHREYEFIIEVRPPGTEVGQGWDGTGTCSTLESKYRYRGSSRKCPQCGKETIFKSKKGGGWFCWIKKGGCGENFAAGDQRIEGQQEGKMEHENPPDNWNTVRKMAFKRGFVHAIINATNTSELWSQDLEDLDGNAGVRPGVAEPDPEDDLPFESAKPTPQKPQDAPGGVNTQCPSKPSAPAKPAPAPPLSVATPEQRARLITVVDSEKDGRWRATTYYIEITALLPNESLEDLPLRFVPRWDSQMRELGERIAAFHATGKAERCVWMAAETGLSGGTPQASGTSAGAGKSRVSGHSEGAPAPAPKPTQAPGSIDPEWWRDVIVPVPRKGQKRDAYMKNPDTIGSLFDERHGTDDLAQEARQRLWGFVTHFDPKGWTKRDGTQMPPSDADIKFREALDAFADWFEKNHPDEKL